MSTESSSAAPAQTFLVGRARRNFADGSSFGVIGTTRQASRGGDGNRLYGADTLIRLFRKKLELTSFIMRTESDGLHGDDQARLFDATWRDDTYTLSSSYDDVQPNFRPDVGFVRRSDMRHSNVDLSWRPRPGIRSAVRNFTFGAVSDLYWDSAGNPETREHRASAGIQLQNSSAVSVNVTRTSDTLTDPFAIVPSLVLAPGKYEYQRYGMSANSDAGRALSGTVSVSTGEFWNGHSTATSGSVELKPSYHFNAELTLSRNDARLPQGRFTTNIVGARLLWAFTSKAFLNSFIQYNATAKQFSTNTRFNLIHRPLSDLFLVVNERRDTTTGALIERDLIVKFTNLFDF
jgi:hypothetical protein